jgi:DDE superfamily endonuclease
VHGKRHKTPAHIARLLLAHLVRWFPARHFIFVGDSGYGTSETARLCSKHRQHLTLVSKFDGDAALYEPPLPRPRGTMGRPRVKGQKLASPQSAPEVLKPSENHRLARQIDGHILRYAHMCTPCTVGTVVFSNTRSFTGVLKTLAVIPGNYAIRLGRRGIDDGQGHEPSKGLPERPCLMEGPKSSLEPI